LDNMRDCIKKGRFKFPHNPLGRPKNETMRLGLR
jgi:hypothetical protein